MIGLFIKRKNVSNYFETGFFLCMEEMISSIIYSTTYPILTDTKNWSLKAYVFNNFSNGQAHAAKTWHLASFT